MFCFEETQKCSTIIATKGHVNVVNTDKESAATTAITKQNI